MKKRDWTKIRRNIKKAIVLCMIKGQRYESNGMDQLALACYWNADKFNKLLLEIEGQ